MKRATSGFTGGGHQSAYAAASSTSAELQAFHPPFVTSDGAYEPSRQKITARVHDLVRNDGWASGGVSAYLDSVIGCDLRLSVKPDWRALAVHNPAFDATWAREFTAYVEAQWRTWAYDIGKFCDIARHNTVGELFALAFRHQYLDGDAIGILHWRDRGGKFGTTLEVMHPDRMSNPEGAADSIYLRAGVQKDTDGAAVGYHFQGAHPSDYVIDGVQQFSWSYVERETAWGRPQVVHHYHKNEAGQTRGTSRLSPIVERLKMLTKYDRMELQAAVLNAVLAAYIEAPADHEFMETLLSDGDSSNGIGTYQNERAAFHDTTRTQFNNVRIPTLFPGEKIGFLDSKRPNDAFADFEAQALRNIASGLGISYEQLSRDWSKTNYSSARQSLIEVWRGYASDRQKFANGFADPVYAAFLEEVIYEQDVPMPSGAVPDFWEERTAFCRCKWIGPARGWVDPVKEAQGAAIRMENGLSTLEQECQEQGLDYEDVLDQRQREKAMMEERGLSAPGAGEVKETQDDDA